MLKHISPKVIFTNNLGTKNTIVPLVSGYAWFPKYILFGFTYSVTEVGGLQIPNSEISILHVSMKQKSCQYYTTVPCFSGL